MASAQEFMPIMTAAALEAGAAALAIRDGGELETARKSDASPVTRADRLAEAIILKALGEAFPGIPVVAEEACSAGIVPASIGPRFFLVDPIDGTREFIGGFDEFTVNIALMEGGYPVAGVVHAPALKTLFTGSPAGAVRQRDGGPAQPIRSRAANGPLVAVASRSHRTAETNAFLDRLPIERVEAVGSSFKFCRVAEGSADVYPCFGPTMEWDTAAGQAVLEAAGGRVVDAEDRRLAYGKTGRADLADFRNPSFVALGADISLPG